MNQLSYLTIAELVALADSIPDHRSPEEIQAAQVLLDAELAEIAALLEG
jgi:hypothetical protein